MTALEKLSSRPNSTCVVMAASETVIAAENSAETIPNASEIAVIAASAASAASTASTTSTSQAATSSLTQLPLLSRCDQDSTQTSVATGCKVACGRDRHGIVANGTVPNGRISDGILANSRFIQEAETLELEAVRRARSLPAGEWAARALGGLLALCPIPALPYCDAALCHAISALEVLAPCIAGPPRQVCHCFKSWYGSAKEQVTSIPECVWMMLTQLMSTPIGQEIVSRGDRIRLFINAYLEYIRPPKTERIDKE